MSPIVIPPTDQEIELALDVISRYAKVQKASGEADRALAAFREKQAKKNSLIAECDQLQKLVYRRLVEALPKDLRELLGLYELMIIAPYAINRKSFSLFQAAYRKTLRLLGIPGIDRSSKPL